MIRSVPVGTQFTFRRRMGSASSASGLTSLATAGIGAGVSLATAAVSDWLNSIQLSHNADSAATAIANQFATQMGNLDSAYLNTPNPTCADQRAALDAFDMAWAWVQSPQGCGNPGYGSAGNRCISERAPGGKYDATAANRNPIANDPRVTGCDTSSSVLLPSSTGYTESGITAGGGSSTTGQTAAQIAAAALAATATPPSSVTTVSAPGAVVATTASNYLLIGAAALGAVLLLKAL